MSFEPAARAWEVEVMRLLAEAGREAPPSDVEEKIRALDDEVGQSERAFEEKLRELGLDPEQLRAQNPSDPPLPVAAVPEDPEEAIRALDAQVVEAEAAFQAKLRELGLDPEQLSAQPLPGTPPRAVLMPEDPEESLRALDAQASQSEAAFLEEIRKLGIDPATLKD